ncbi:hypothetical protein SLE2022_250470 [Rubroshorea leprosula]
MERVAIAELLCISDLPAFASLRLATSHPNLLSNRDIDSTFSRKPQLKSHCGWCALAGRRTSRLFRDQDRQVGSWRNRRRLKEGGRDKRDTRFALKALIFQLLVCHSIMDEHDLPFKVNDLVEVRSYIAGYRGAWFRCKIKSIGRRNWDTTYALEYVDYPDEKVKSTKIYQKYSKRESKRQLMVGDSVDWFTDGCFWCGRIKEILGKEMARIELLPPPAGEGLSYEVYCKDLRPSLDWSPVDGWTLPSKGSKSYHSCVHLMKPQSQVSTLSEGKEGVLVEAGSLLQHGISNASRFSAGAEPFLEMSEQSTKPAASGKKTSTSEEISNKLPDSGKKKYDESGHSKRIKTDEKFCLNSTRSATILQDHLGSFRSIVHQPPQNESHWKNSRDIIGIVALVQKVLVELTHLVVP